MPPLATGAPLHIHDTITETFAVESGALEIDLGKAGKRLLGPGEEISISPGTPHGFRNSSASETIFVTTATPGAELERFLRTMYDLANCGRTDASGAPRNPVDLAAALAPMDMTIAPLPRALQRVLVRALLLARKVFGPSASRTPPRAFGKGA
nr:cupin domain-containing protein [Qipengyuania qiaonensis]